MPEDGSWWRRLGAAFNPRSELTVDAQAKSNIRNAGRAHDTGIGFAAVSVRSSHRQRRSALENVRATSSNSNLATPLELGPPISILPRSPSTPPTFQRKEQPQQKARSCPSSPPRSNLSPRTGPPEDTTPHPHGPPERQQNTEVRSREPEQHQRPSNPQPTPPSSFQAEPQRQTCASSQTTPSKSCEATSQKEAMPSQPPAETSTPTQANVERTPTQVAQTGALLSSSGTPATLGHAKANLGSPVSLTGSRRSSSLPRRALSAMLSSPGSTRHQSPRSPPPAYHSPTRASHDGHCHQRTLGDHIVIHPSHRRRASSTGSLAEAATLLATRNQYSATLSSLIAMGYPKQRAEEALWKHPTRAAAYLEHQDHAGQDVLISDCEWCIPWLGLAQMIEVGSPPKPKPKLQQRPETAPKTIEKPILVENPRERGTASDLPTKLPVNGKEQPTTPPPLGDSESPRVNESTSTRRKSTASQTSISLASVYSQDTTTDSIVPVVGHATGENCQVCKTAVGGVCQWSDWGWEHGRWEREFFNDDC